jgi:hypothetical protein
MTAITQQFPFVGRAPLLERLATCYRGGRHVLLVGPPGVGKSRLLGELAHHHPLLTVPRCRCLGDLLETLEPAAGLAPDDLPLAARVHRLAARLPSLGRPLVLENVRRVPPKVAHFVRYLLIRQPVWLVASSVEPLELGHVWPILFHFKPLNVPPFSLDDTKAFLAAAPFPGDRVQLLSSALRMHRLAAGHPATLVALVLELARRSHDLRTAAGLHLLALHTRITRVETQLAAAP